MICLPPCPGGTCDAKCIICWTETQTAEEGRSSILCIFFPTVYEWVYILYVCSYIYSLCVAIARYFDLFSFYFSICLSEENHQKTDIFLPPDYTIHSAGTLNSFYTTLLKHTRPKSGHQWLFVGSFPRYSESYTKGIRGFLDEMTVKVATIKILYNPY